MLATQQKVIPNNPIQNNSIPNNSIQPTVNNQQNPGQNQQNIVNNFNIINPVSQDTIIVEHDKEKHEFTFKNAQSQLIGTFNIYQLFKYINKDIDMFLIDVVIGSTDTIISKYIYDIDNDKTKSYDLLSHTDSPFTGNIELLVKLYADIIKIENELYEKIMNLPKDLIEIIKITNNKFIYNLLLRILKISNMLLEQPNIDKQKKDVLLRYSIGTVYKLSNMTREELAIKKLQYDSIENDINKIIKIQSSINNKLDLLKNSIDTQNNNINFIVNEYSSNKPEKDNLSSTVKSKSSEESSEESSKESSNKFDDNSSKKSYKSLSKSPKKCIKQSDTTSYFNSIGKNNSDENITYSISFESIPSLSNLSNPYNILDTAVSQKDFSTAGTKNNLYVSDKTKSIIKTFDVGSVILTSDKSDSTF